MNRRREGKGQAIVEGVMGLWLIVAGIVVGVLLLINVGSYLLSKSKLSYIAGQVATMAANEEQSPYYVNDATTKSHASTNAKTLCKDMGISGTPTVTTTIVPITPGSPTPGSVTVSIQMGAFNFREVSGILAIPLGDTSVALLDPTRPKYCAMIEECIGTTGVQTYVPCYGAQSFAGAVTNQIGNFPKEIANVDSFGQGTLWNAQGSIVFNNYPPQWGGPPVVGCTVSSSPSAVMWMPASP